MPLTNETVSLVGSHLGFSFTLYNNKGAPNNPSDGELCMAAYAKLYCQKDRPPTLVFTGVVPGHMWCWDHSDRQTDVNNTGSIYVLNLNTMKPTKKSWRQLQLPENVVKKLRAEYP